MSDISPIYASKYAIFKFVVIFKNLKIVVKTMENLTILSGIVSDRVRITTHAPRLPKLII